MLNTCTRYTQRNARNYCVCVRVRVLQYCTTHVKACLPEAILFALVFKSLFMVSPPLRCGPSHPKNCQPSVKLSRLVGHTTDSSLQASAHACHGMRVMPLRQPYAGARHSFKEPSLVDRPSSACHPRHYKSTTPVQVYTTPSHMIKETVIHMTMHHMTTPQGLCAMSTA